MGGCGGGASGSGGSSAVGGGEAPARSLGDTGGRRPMGSREALPRGSSSLMRPGCRARPLLLESAATGGQRPRPAREDAASADAVGAGALGPGLGQQPLSAGGNAAGPGSSRRLRRSARPGPSPKPGDEESMSPSPTAARRRRDLAMKTLHKMAEIYGVQGPHRPVLPKCGERVDEALLREAFLREALLRESPREDLPEEDSERLRRPSGAELPEDAAVEACGGPVGPSCRLAAAPGLLASSSSQAAEALSAPLRAGPGGPPLGVGLDAWSARMESGFGTTVRHLDGPPLSARFHGGVAAVGSRSGAPAEPGFKLSLAPRPCATPAAPLASAPAGSAAAASSATLAVSAGAGGAAGAGPGGSCSPAALGAGGGAGAAPAGSGGIGSSGPEASFQSVDLPRRIKSLSPPRWKRPQPLNLGSAQAGQPAASPSSAPSGAQPQQQLEPCRHANEPSVASARSRACGGRPQQPGGAAALVEDVASPPQRGCGDDLYCERGAFPRLLSPDDTDTLGADVPHRPFTPPVVPVGWLLRNVCGSGRPSPGRAAEEAAVAGVTGMGGPDGGLWGAPSSLWGWGGSGAVLGSVEAAEESILEAPFAGRVL